MFASPLDASEVWAYRLLSKYGVPTLSLHGWTNQALLLEDLNASRSWRLATREDVQHARMGRAVAEWYRTLHDAGREVLSSQRGPPSFLKRESDALNASVVRALGKQLGLPEAPLWALAAKHIEGLKATTRSLDETLTYNDFHWTNVALSRGEESVFRAIVFDYHLLGIGLRAGDYRNVVGSLGGPAREAFAAAYGPVDEREAILDRPLASLYGLTVALERPKWPRWADSLLDEVKNGELCRALNRALEYVGT